MHGFTKAIFLLIVICTSVASGARSTEANTILNFNFPLENPSEGTTGFGLNGLVITDPDIPELPNLVATTTLVGLRVYVNGTTPSTDLILIKHDGLDCVSETKTGEDYGLVANEPKLVEFTFTGTECQLYPETRNEFRLSVGAGSGYTAKGITSSGIASFQVANTGGFFGYQNAQTYQTRFETVDITDGTNPGDVQFDITAFVSLDEYEPSISSRNPTAIQTRVSLRPATTTTGITEPIENPITEETQTAQPVFEGLADGTYDYNIRFVNTGCVLGLSECPFQIATVNGQFVLSGGVLDTNSTTYEFIDNTIPLARADRYEDCGLTSLSGCINNSFRFLFIPSDDTINELLQIGDEVNEKIPFVYVAEIQNVVEEFFNTPYDQTIDVELDLGFGTITMIDREMIEAVPYVGLLNQLIAGMLWFIFAMSMYRMGLGIHNKETT